MPKMSVAFALDVKELERFDRWRGQDSRGLALTKLLDFAEGKYTVTPVLEKKEDPGPSAEELAKAIKAEGLKQALRLTEKRVGVTPVVVDGDEVRKVDYDEGYDP